VFVNLGIVGTVVWRPSGFTSVPPWGIFFLFPAAQIMFIFFFFPLIPLLICTTRPWDKSVCRELLLDPRCYLNGLNFHFISVSTSNPLSPTPDCGFSSAPSSPVLPGDDEGIRVASLVLAVASFPFLRPHFTSFRRSPLQFLLKAQVCRRAR